MSYIIDNAVVEGKGRKSFFVKDNKIDYIAEHLRRYRFMRMDVSEYIMVRGHVMLDYSLLTCRQKEDYKQRQKELIEMGCTTILVVGEAKYEKEIAQKIKEVKHAMINSSLDYIVGLKAPLSLLKSSTIRLCKKHKIPFILIELSEDDNFYSVPWGWIREALYSYKLPLYPLWKIEDQKLLEERKELWEEITEEYSIPSQRHAPEARTPIEKKLLKQIGVYPLKGELLIGGDVDYNLYDRKQIELVDQLDNIDYDIFRPIITMLRGKTLKSEDQTFYYPGYGKEVKIKIPGYFI